MDEEKKSGLIALIIVIILFGSFGVIAYKTANKDKYTYTSPLGDEFWVQKLPIGYSVLTYINEQPYDLRLRNDPKNVTNIPIEPNIRDKVLSKSTIYFTLKPDLNSVPVIGATDIAGIISRKLGIFDKQTLGAATEPSNNTSLDVITCSNVTKDIGVVWLRIGPETKVFYENDCVIVQGTDEWEIIRAADRLTYQILTIMD